MTETGKRGRVMVVDDSSLVLGIVEEALEEAGYEVTAASSWVEVNVALKAGRPDLVLMDVQMPSLRGESFCRILKDSEAFREIPVVLFSSLDAAEIRQLAEEAGADAWLPKRLRPDLLREDVDALFSRLVDGGDPS